MCVLIHKRSCRCLHMNVEAKGQLLVLFLGAVYPLYFKAGSLTDTWNLPISLGWLDRKPQESPLLRSQTCATTPDFLQGCWELNFDPHISTVSNLLSCLIRLTHIPSWILPLFSSKLGITSLQIFVMINEKKLNGKFLLWQHVLRNYGPQKYQGRRH